MAVELGNVDASWVMHNITLLQLNLYLRTEKSKYTTDKPGVEMNLTELAFLANPTKN